MLHCGHSYHDICIGDTKCKKCHSFLANCIEELTEACNEGLLDDDDKDANRNEEGASQDLLLDDDEDDEDEIIGQATPPLFNDFKGLKLFRCEFSKQFDSLIRQGDDIFLFVTVNVICPLPCCSSHLAPFCFMKNSNTHACIVSALSMRVPNSSMKRSRCVQARIVEDFTYALRECTVFNK